MAQTLGAIINAARNRHPAFHPRRVPDVVVASYLSDVQSSALTEAAELDANRVAMQCSIAFATSPANRPGVVGAGSAGGLPAGAPIAADVATSPAAEAAGIGIPGVDTGPSFEVDTANAGVLLNDIVVASATALDVTFAGVAWVVNQFANQIAIVTAGTGFAQKRTVISNTATKLVISSGADGQQWATIPDATSLIRVIQGLIATPEDVVFITELPPRQSRFGYLVSIDAQGKPYINIAAPIEVIIDAGIPLPSFQRLIGGSVRLKSTAGLDPLTSPLTIRTYADRYHWGPSYTCWLENDQLFLSGTLSDWSNAVSIDLRMVPDPGDFTALTDVIVLPSFAGAMLVAAAADFMAQRCNGQPDTPPIDVKWFQREREKADATFLKAFGSSARAVAKYVHEVW